MTKLNALCLIQARTESKRLPGKALLKLGDHPILEWVIRRVQSSKKLSQVVLATTTRPADDALYELATSLGIEVFRGDENDVLARFTGATELFPADVVVRVCADNPFVSGHEIDVLISDFEANPVDYHFNHRPDGRCNYPDGAGAELFTVEVLRKLNLSVTDNSMREHLTLALSTLGEHRIRAVEARSSVAYPYLKFDLDVKTDYETLTQLVETANLNFESTIEEIINAKIALETQHKLELLFGLNRSLAGQDNRETLNGLKDIVDLEIFEVPSGTKVFDWVIPQEWKISQGFIEDARNNRIVDIQTSPLHVASYSQPCDLKSSFEEVSSHIHTHEVLDGAIPYRTLYYKSDWAFCVNKQQLKQLKSAEQPLHLVIDSEFTKGSMSYGEKVLVGKSNREVLISAYICHPAMANDSLSGVLLTAMLARHINSNRNRKWTYRIVFVPETIGAIAYLKINEVKMKMIDFGLQVTTVGGPGSYQVKESFNPDHVVNSILKNVLDQSKEKYEIKEFDIHGSDERQYSSPGFRINMTTLAKDIYYTYPQYHSSLDNLDFVNGAQIAETFELYVQVIDQIEKLKIYERVDPHGEPMLSQHGLYEIFGGSLLPNLKISHLDLVLSVLFLSDGLMPTSQISSRLKVELESVEKICQLLVSKNMLREI